jgi:hypothetical protein
MSAASYCRFVKHEPGAARSARFDELEPELAVDAQRSGVRLQLSADGPPQPMLAGERARKMKQRLVSAH